MRPIAIDPPYCGCTECIVGEYVPLDKATPAQVYLMMMRVIADNTGAELVMLDTLRKRMVFRAWTGGVYETYEFDFGNLQA